MQVRSSVLLGLFSLALAPVGSAQTAYPRPPGANSTPAAQQSSPATAAQTPQDSATAPAASPQVVPATDAPAVKALPATVTKEKKGKKKEEYTGPSNIETLPASPMVDASGKAQLDPDGKPLMNPPVKQQRDKKGHPLFDDKGKPVFQTASELGYDEHGKKLHAEKVKPPKMVPVHVTRGTFTVDGITGKAALNYDIPDLKYLYFFVPGTGIVIVSNTPFPAAKEYKDAFNDKQLDVMVGEHKLELASDTTMLGRKPESAFVKIDRDYSLPSRFPVVGYGTLRVQPYAWPGAKPNDALKDGIDAPPLPKNLQPTLAVQPCPKGTVRAVAVPARSGETAAIPPCVLPTAVKSVNGLGSTK